MVFRKLFGRAPVVPEDLAWWRDAERIANAPTRDALAGLRASLAASPPGADNRERQDEMIEGIASLLDLMNQGGSLPVVDTQHRVIGDDTCHLVLPAGLSASDLPAPGKLFLTSTRIIFSGAGVKSWPWHRVQKVARADRSVSFTSGGAPVEFRLNTYADAFAVVYLARRLTDV